MELVLWIMTALLGIMIILAIVAIVMVIVDFVSETFKPGCIDESFTTVSVKIVDAEKHASYHTWVMAGKVPIMQLHPARHEITVMYDDCEYVFDNETLYDKYKKHIGEYISGVLRTRTYKNGKIRNKIIEIK